MKTITVSKIALKCNIHIMDHGKNYAIGTYRYPDIGLSVRVEKDFKPVFFIAHNDINIVFDSFKFDFFDYSNDRMNLYLKGQYVGSIVLTEV